MTPVASFCGQKVALFGLGGSGIVTARALVAGGAQVSAWDDSEVAREQAQARGITVVSLENCTFQEFSALILAPGVPLTHPRPHWTVEKAHAAGIEVIGDIELFCRERARLAPAAPFVAITGTNGKSTTTALIAHLFREAGHDVQMGGNIGTAILALERPEMGRIHVIECSSFQIDLAPTLRPSVGVMLNLSPDHLDRHGTMAHYAEVKERLVSGSDTAIVGVDDAWSNAIADQADIRGQTLVRVSIERRLDTGIHRKGSDLFWTCLDEERPIASLEGIGTLRGVHNAQNAAAAIAAVSALGLRDDAIRSGLASFPGLAHRMEIVGNLGRALVINDSKATNADATGKALASFPGSIFWIAGGQSKEGGISSLARYFPRISKAYLIGEAAEEFASVLDGAVQYTRSGTLEQALADAVHDIALESRESVILMSPACASFDQFRNFEDRGDRFRVMVAARPEFRSITRG
ncbi:MAG: UDP-N-acetylmuramoyl-L-alanine--D-glutamate ligase [Hyphomicrobiales bacterium]